MRSRRFPGAANISAQEDVGSAARELAALDEQRSETRELDGRRCLGGDQR